jgi:hypothetical protein
MHINHNVQYSVCRILLNNRELPCRMPMNSTDLAILSLTAMLDFLERHDTGLGYGMVNSQILAQLLPWVLMRVPSDCEEVPFPSYMDIHSPDAPLCSIWYTRLAVILVWVSSILESSLSVPIFVLVVAPNLHPLGVWSPLGSLDILPWLQSSLIVPRHLSRRLSVVVLTEFMSEVAIPGYTILSGDIHELDALASQWHP